MEGKDVTGKEKKGKGKQRGVTEGKEKRRWSLASSRMSTGGDGWVKLRSNRVQV